MEGLTYIEQCTGSRIQLALSKESGRIVHVDRVRRGKECDCECLGCGESLVANQGEVRIHYFSHLPDSTGINNRPCKNPKLIFETLSHEMGKHWIEEVKELEVPPYFHKKHKDSDGCTYNSVPVLEKRKLVFDKVKLESWQADNRYRPDCIGYIGDQAVVIEIYVTHKVDEKKIKKIRADGLPAIEVVLKPGVMDDRWESIDKAMRSGRAVRWLNCPEGETPEKRQQSEQEFNRQREAFDRRQGEINRQRRRKARSEAVIRQAEEEMEFAIESVPEQAQEKTEVWVSRHQAEIKMHRGALIRHAEILDKLLMVDRRKKSKGLTSFVFTEEFAKSFKKKIDEEFEQCKRDLLKGYEEVLKNDISFEELRALAEKSLPPEEDERWRYAEKIEDED